MGKTFACFAVLLTVLLCNPAAAVAQQKKEQKVIKEKTTDKDYAELAKLKDVSGKITELDLEGGTMVLSLEGVRYEPNLNAQDAESVAGAKRGVDRLQGLLQEDLKGAQLHANNPQLRQQDLLQAQQHQQQLQVALAQLAAAQQKMAIPVKYAKDFQINVQDNVKVARSKLEQKRDEKGAPIKYSAEELKKLKSPDIAGAFTATPEDLRVGQTVKVYLLPPKKEAAKKIDPNAKKSDNQDPKKTPDAKDKQGTTTTVPLAGRAIVRMVLIVDDPYLPPEPRPATKP